MTMLMNDQPQFDQEKGSKSLATIVAMEGVFAALAIALSFWLGIDLLRFIHFVPIDLAIIIAATVIMIGAIELLWALAPSLIDKLVRLLAEQFREMGISFSWPVIILISIAAGIGEELLFRGAVQNWFQEMFGWPVALIAASLLFGLCHAVTFSYFLVSAGIGLLLGALFLLTSNLAVVISVHALYDVYAFWRLRPMMVDGLSEKIEA